VFCVVALCAYVLLWLAFSAAAGSIASAWLAGRFLQGTLSPLDGDDFFVVGAVIAPLLVVPVAWVARRAGWFHVLTVLIGLLGCALAVAAAVRLAADGQYLWQAVALLLAVAALTFVLLVLAGIAGLLVRQMLPAVAP
jgi:hypothetical protein